jgi:hypothetical protein
MEGYLGWAQDCFESRTIRKGWGSIPQPSTNNASADGAVPGLLNQVMGVRISPEAPVMPLWTNLVKSALSKGVP